MSILFNYEQHKKLWMLMKSNIREYVKGRAVPSFADAEMTVDDLKALQFKNENMGKEYKNGTRKAPLFYCYACQYAWDLLRGETVDAVKSDRCSFCPLTGWNATKCFTGQLTGDDGEKGLFFQLIKAVEDGNLNLAEDLCERIAKLGLRSGVETGDDEGSGSGGDDTIPGGGGDDTVPGGGGDSGEGGDTPTDVPVQSINAHGVTVINRSSALSKLPLTILVKNGNRYYSDPLALTVGYTENSAIIVNNTDSVIQYVVIDRMPNVALNSSSSTPATLAANGNVTINRANNLNKTPAVVLVKNTYASSTSSGLNSYIDATPYFTIANDEDKIYLYNDTNEDLTYIVIDVDNSANRSTLTLPAGTSKTVGSVTSSRADVLTRPLPEVLIHDLTSGSRTYGKYLNSTGIIDVVAIDTSTSDSVVYENYSLKSQNCIVLDPV